MVDIKSNLEKIRKLRGLTQQELADATGLTQRIIAYSENETEQISSKNLVKIATALKVTTDELLGLKNNFIERTKEENRVWKKVKKIIQLSPKDQEAVFQLIKTLTTNFKNKKK